MIWYEFKLFVEHATGASMDALHVVIGVLLQLVAAALMRVSIGTWRPWIAVLVLELCNELVDLSVEQWPPPGMQLGEGSRDLLLTMALPTILLLVVRRWPRLFSEARPSE